MILVFCLSGCGQQPLTEESSTSTSNLKFESVNEIEYSSVIEEPQQNKETEEQTSIMVEDEESTENIEEYSDDSQEYYDDSYVDSYYDDNSSYYSGGYSVPYSDMYNEDGPSHSMPGWYDGNVETYYNASGHYMADEWTLDDEGFYHDSEGRYVIGVSIDSGYEYGDIVQTGKGEAVVYDYGAGVDNVHDFATNW